MIITKATNSLILLKILYKRQMFLKGNNKIKNKIYLESRMGYLIQMVKGLRKV